MTNEELKKKYKKQYGIDSIDPNDSDFTKIPDEVLSNAHIYGYYDKVSIQAGVEMSRRLKNEIKNLNKITDKASRITKRLSIVLIFIGIIQLVVILHQFIFTVIEGQNKLYGTLLLMVLTGFLLWIMSSFNKTFQRKSIKS